MAPCKVSIGKNLPIVQDLYALFESGELPLKEGMQPHEYWLDHIDKYGQYETVQFR